MIQISHYLVSALVMGLALLVWRARPASATNRLFGVFTLVIAVWVLGIATMQSAVNLDFAARLTFAAASLIPPTFSLVPVARRCACHSGLMTKMPSFASASELLIDSI